jgi:hypothetical protein
VALHGDFRDGVERRHRLMGSADRGWVELHAELSHFVVTVDSSGDGGIRRREATVALRIGKSRSDGIQARFDSMMCVMGRAAFAFNVRATL